MQGILRHACGVLLLTTSAQAEVSVRFEERSGGDHFVVEAHCALRDVRVEIDVSASNGRLIFDTQRGGPGENVPQIPTVLSPPERPHRMADMADGAEHLHLYLEHLDAGETLRLVVDLDDRTATSSGQRESVRSNEIGGTVVRIAQGDGSAVTAHLVAERQAVSLACPSSKTTQ